jgi:hypothetical protein
MLNMHTSSAVGKRLEQDCIPGMFSPILTLKKFHAFLASRKNLEQEVMGKIQGSEFKKVWAVLKYDEATLHTYASQAMAALADAGEKTACIHPAVQLRAARKLVNLPEKYEGQHVLGLQPLRNSHD